MIQRPQRRIRRRWRVSVSGLGYFCWARNWFSTERMEWPLPKSRVPRASVACLPTVVHLSDSQSWSASVSELGNDRDSSKFNNTTSWRPSNSTSTRSCCEFAWLPCYRLYILVSVPWIIIHRFILISCNNTFIKSSTSSPMPCKPISQWKPRIQRFKGILLAAESGPDRSSFFNCNW
jgi:hypothetical protein